MIQSQNKILQLFLAIYWTCPILQTCLFIINEFKYIQIKYFPDKTWYHKINYLNLNCYSVCVDWCALSGRGKTVLPTDNDPWRNTWVSDDTLRWDESCRILAIGSRALILYHPRCRFATGLNNSTCSVDLCDDDTFSISSRRRFSALCEEKDSKFDIELNPEVDGVNALSSLEKTCRFPMFLVVPIAVVMEIER